MGDGGPPRRSARIDAAEDRWPRGSLLALLSDEAILRDILSLGTPRDFPAGHHLLHQGDRTTDVLIITEGIAKVVADTESGSAALLAIRVAGDALGELAALSGKARLATVTAAGLVQCRRISRDDFTAFLERQPKAAVALSQYVGTKLDWATHRRIDFGAYAVDVRLARLLADLAERHGEQTMDGLTVGVPLSQPELAALIGASEPSVHRAIRTLRRRGILRTGYRQLVLSDVDALRAFADLGPEDNPPTAPG